MQVSQGLLFPMLSGDILRDFYSDFEDLVLEAYHMKLKHRKVDPKVQRLQDRFLPSAQAAGGVYRYLKNFDDPQTALREALFKPVTSAQLRSIFFASPLAPVRIMPAQLLAVISPSTVSMMQQVLMMPHLQTLSRVQRQTGTTYHECCFCRPSKGQRLPGWWHLATGGSY